MRIFVFALVSSFLFGLSLLGPGVSASPEGRGLLWRAVQSCLLNHSLTGASFPCESVDTSAGRDKGFAVIRAPLDDAHVIVMPTVRTIGIEADRLRGATAPNYFHQAWMARRFATDGLARAPSRDDYAMAVNSRPGRSQDQLHIHVACIRADVKRMLKGELAAIHAKPWTTVKILPKAPAYKARFLTNDELAGANVLDLVAHGLDIAPDKMGDVTVAIVGLKTAGFVILARQRLPAGRDEPHAETLLDRGCSAFAKK